MRKGLSQEALKLVACGAMLLDHIGYLFAAELGANAVAGASFQPGGTYSAYLLLRMIGRLALPIFAFLLTEGFHRTRDRKKYVLRLAATALLSELPFNLVASGSPLWRYQQSTMVTLLLGFLALAAMERCEKLSVKPLALIPFALAAELLRADYGWAGVVLIALFEISRYTANQNLVRFCGMLVLFHYMPGMVLRFGAVTVPLQAFGALAMVFIGAYDGSKRTRSKAMQWGFYLFYPVHLLILYVISLW